MNTAKIMGTVRTVLALVAGVLVALGVFDESTAAAGQEVIVGALGAILAVVTWVASIRAPEKQDNELVAKAYRQ